MLAPRKRSALTSLLALAALALIAGPIVAGTISCKKEGPTCNPDDENFKTIQLVFGPDDQINLDAEGKPRATVLRVYQLTDDRVLDTVTFEQIWEDAKTALGDAMLDEKEFIVYPGKAEVHELKPNPEAKFVMAAAIFREPVGRTWFAEWDVPQFHGDSACAAKKQKQAISDPCFYLGVELNEIDGGHKPPNNFHADGLVVTCPGPPLMMKPPAEKSAKEKRKEKRKKKRKENWEKTKKGAEETQEKGEKAQETNEKADAAGDAATTKPEGPSVPGKD